MTHVALMIGHNMLFWASYMHVLYFCLVLCSAQLSMFHMERRSRNTLIIIIISHMTFCSLKDHCPL